MRNDISPITMTPHNVNLFVPSPVLSPSFEVNLAPATVSPGTPSPSLADDVAFSDCHSDVAPEPDPEPLPNREKSGLGYPFSNPRSSPPLFVPAVGVVALGVPGRCGG